MVKAMLLLIEILLRKNRDMYPCYFLLRSFEKYNIPYKNKVPEVVLKGTEPILTGKPPI